MTKTVFGIVGGTGFYRWDDVQVLETQRPETPFGAPSGALVRARVAGRECWFVPRHGDRHNLLPHEIPYRANVYALRAVGCTHLLSVSAVGSLREEIRPGDLVVPDQYIDRTIGRPATFFGSGIVAHVSFGEPTCSSLRRKVLAAAREVGGRVHDGGTYVCMEGPAFSTKAESHLHRSWGAAVIGMTAMPEAKLAREAQLHYVALAYPSDYDAWRDDEAPVSVDAILALIKSNTQAAQRVIKVLLQHWEEDRSDCDCAKALVRGLITRPADVPPAGRELLATLAPELGNGDPELRLLRFGTVGRL